MMRFHNLNRMMSVAKTQDLEKKLKQIAGKKGWEYWRRGGSNGIARKDKANQVLKLLADPSTLPVKGKAAKIIREVDHWRVLYISRTIPKENVEKLPGSYVQVKVYGPNQGGSFSLPPEMVDKYQAVRELISAKMYAANIVQDWNNDNSKVPVQKEATKNELKKIDLAWELSTTTHETRSRSRSFLKMYAMLNKFTYVSHPVGFHVDTFGRNRPSLENKATFCYKIQELDWVSMGRGGKGLGYRSFALLDWEAPRLQRRTIFVNTTQQHQTRVTDAVWRAFWNDQLTVGARRHLGNEYHPDTFASQKGGKNNN